MRIKKVTLFTSLLFLSIFNSYADQLLIENQVSSTYSVVFYKFITDGQSQFETDQEYKDRLIDFYSNKQLIYFFNKDIESYEVTYNAENQILTVKSGLSNISDNYLIGTEKSIFITPETTNYHYLNVGNFDEFSNWVSIDLPMLPEDAQENINNIGLLVGFEVIIDFANPDPDQIAYSILDIVSDNIWHRFYHMVVELKSITIYNLETDEIYAQKHLFTDDSEVWTWSNEESNEGDSNDHESDNSSTCFINTIICNSM